MPNPLRRDPSRTTMLRKKYMADMNRRFAKVSRAIQELIVKDDALGLDTSKPLIFQQQVSKQAWRFKSDANKVKEYRKWLQQQIDAKILTVNAISGQPWTATYAESAYRKGMMRAYTQVHKQALAGDVAFYEGGKAQFLREAFASPVSLSKIELIYTRAFDELKGVTAVMGQQMSRTLANGLIKGDGPRAIARELRNNVATITKRRALVIARTEVIHAHAEGQLDAFERLGVKELGLMAEWMTAGDNRVCEDCGGLEGHIFTVEEARGMLPLHPNCRCAWTPYLKGVSKRKRIIKRKPRVIPAKQIISKVTHSPISAKANGLKFTKVDREDVKYYASDGYRNINSAQRGWMKGQKLEQAFLKDAAGIEKSLLKMSGYRGTTYRSVSFGGSAKDKVKFLDEIKKNNVYQAKQFLSSSKDRAMVESRYARGEVVNFYIEGKSGRDISKISWTPSEQEVIFLKGTLFKVDKVVNNTVYLIEL